MQVEYTNSHLTQSHYVEIGMAFRDFFDSFILPTRTLKLRNENSVKYKRDFIA